MRVLISNGSWISPGTVDFTRCPSCHAWRARYHTRQPQRSIPYDDRGYSPTIKGDVFYVMQPWCSRSGLTWAEQGMPHMSHWKPAKSSNAFPSVGILLKDPKFLILPESLEFTAGEHEVFLERFHDRPPIKALKADGPFQVRVTWTAVSNASRNGEEETGLCITCLNKEVTAHACFRQGHLTLAPWVALDAAAQAAVSWLQDLEPTTAPCIFNHSVTGARVWMHSGRVAIIDSPTEGDGSVSSPDHPGETITLPVGQGPWVAVHPWPDRRGVD